MNIKTIQENIVELALLELIINNMEQIINKKTLSRLAEVHGNQMATIMSCLSGKEEATVLEMHAKECDESSVDADGTCLVCGVTDLL